MLYDEQVLTFGEAAGKLPRFNGKRPHASTLWRWHRKGLHGVHLEARRIGGRYVTSLEALERFSLALADIKDSQPNGAATPAKPATDNQRQRSIQRAESRLQKAGILR